MYDSVRSASEAKKDRDGNMGSLNELPSRISGKLKAKSSQGGFLRASSEYNRVVPYPFNADETKEYSVEKAALLADDSVTDCQVDRDVGERSHLEMKPDIPDRSEDVITDSKISLKEKDHREYEDQEFAWAISILDRMISYTRTSVVEKLTVPHSTESQVGSITFDHLIEAESGEEAMVKGSTDPPWSRALMESCNIKGVKSSTVSSSIHKLEEIESSRREGLQSTVGDTESSEQSRFWSASEIELIPIQNDTVVRAIGSVNIVDQPKAQGQEGLERKTRSRKWQWTCLFPGISREQEVHRRTNFDGHWRSRIGGSARYSIGKECKTDGDETHVPSISREHDQYGRTNFYRHWRSRIGGSARYTIGKNYESDGDETHVPRYRIVAPGQSLERFVTLGKYLVDDDEPSADLSVDT